MPKILHRRPLGHQPVYDIGLAQDHNFVLADGWVASNCFNKSHSTAYAYVTYQTAYLKANYPVEYMAALLTSNSGNKDKVNNYINTCQKMGIKVTPPNINQSNVDFTPSGETILFGFSAVPSLGDGAIDSILTAREAADGAFKSFADFCTHVDLRTVNRGAIETLIKCGAFSQLHGNRQQLLEYIEPATAWAKQRAKERESGQMNLFSLGGDSETNSATPKFDTAPTMPQVPDLPAGEKLKVEKELLGFYISEHPLDRLQSAMQVMAPVSLAQLSEQKKRTLVSCVVMLSLVREITTKKGDRMAFLTLEDKSGEVEGVVFPRSFERLAPLLIQDRSMILWGKADSRDDKVQLIVEDAEPVEQVQMLMVELTPEQATTQTTRTTLKTILQQYNQASEKNKPKVPVVAAIGQGLERQFVRLNQDFWVQDFQGAVNALQRSNYTAHTESLLPSTVTAS